MRLIAYEDSRGFKTMREIKDDDQDDRARYGIVVGPPDFESGLGGLDGYPTEVRKRLNNELFNRGIITLADAMRRRGEVVSALQSALRLDVETIFQSYREG